MLRLCFTRHLAATNILTQVSSRGNLTFRLKQLRMKQMIITGREE